MCKVKQPAPAPATVTPSAPPPPEAVAETVDISEDQKRKNTANQNRTGRTGLTIQRSTVAPTGGAGVQV